MAKEFEFDPVKRDKGGKEYIKNGGDIFIDKKAVYRIKELCEKYNVRLVISSSWRMFTLEATNTLLASIEFKNLIYNIAINRIDIFQIITLYILIEN